MVLKLGNDLSRLNGTQFLGLLHPLLTNVSVFDDIGPFVFEGEGVLVLLVVVLNETVVVEGTVFFLDVFDSELHVHGLVFDLLKKVEHELDFLGLSGVILELVLQEFDVL